MKKLWTLFALALIGASLAGCGSSEPDAKVPVDAPKASDTDAAGGGQGTPPASMGGPTND